MGKKHSKLVGDIKLYLESLPYSKVTIITPGPYGSERSTADIVSCIKGQYVAVEVKIENDGPSKGQNRFIRDVIKAKGIGIIAYSLKDVKYRLEYLGLS